LLSPFAFCVHADFLLGASDGVSLAYARGFPKTHHLFLNSPTGRNPQRMAPFLKCIAFAAQSSQTPASVQNQKRSERIPAHGATCFSYPKMVRCTKITQTRHGAKFAVIYGWMISNAFAKNNDSHQPEG
jgi:hypothetical protein